MFSPSPQQMIVPLSQLVNALHSLKSAASSVVTASVQSLQRDLAPDNDLLLREPSVSLRDVGLSEFGAGQLEELVSRLLPSLGPQDAPSCSSPWRASHISAHSFFHNKHGFPQRTSGSALFHKQHHSPLQSLCSQLHYLPVYVQSRGFKTLKSSSRRMDPAYQAPAETDSYTPPFMKSLLGREKGMEAQTVDQLMKQKNLPEAQQEAFKTGFAEGFMKSQAFTQRTPDSVKRTRLIVLVLLAAGLYGLSRTPFLSVRFRATSGLDSAMDPVEVKNVTFDHVKGVEP